MEMETADSQTSRVVARLRDSLVRGEFAAGERLAELSLVARLGVSRTPIRLALERLAHDGLLIFSANRGFSVRGYSPAEALDAIEMRGVLEGTAARLAAERLVDSAELAPMRRLCDRMDAIEQLTPESAAPFLELNGPFHDAIVDLAKNAALRHAYCDAVSLPFAAPNAIEFPRSAIKYASEMFAMAKAHHRGIVDAITMRQGTRAENLAREHARLAAGVLTSALADRDALSALPGGSLIEAAGRRPTSTA
jgi:GntR family transcriptional regulator of vanillate catabolism